MPKCIHSIKRLTALRELVESGEGFSRNDVTQPDSFTSRIPTLLVAMEIHNM